MTLPTNTQQWLLVDKPTNLPVMSGPSSTFVFETKPLPALKADQVLLKTLFLSNDPVQRGWISANVDPARVSSPPVPLNTPMRAWAIATVVASTPKAFKEGDSVTTSTNWSEYAICDGKDV